MGDRRDPFADPRAGDVWTSPRGSTRTIRDVCRWSGGDVELVRWAAPDGGGGEGPAVAFSWRAVGDLREDGWTCTPAEEADR